MIREIDVNELDQVLKIDRLVLGTNWEDHHYHTEIFNEDSIFLIDVCSNVVRGFILILVLGLDAEILQIATHPDYQKKGLASRLFGTSVEILQDVGVEYLFLEVRESNSCAIEFYRKKGFIQTGVRKNYYGLNRHANLMRKRLSYDCISD
ncbi:ribosomal protein S18-alanine N-acetyltransferase [Erysipelothrix urinaevulpis]|uniref:ribosomal protein S18-alanine N-acetyltransferase n=1 Tax=Erysipelothrix urinaevulpis TaxID=2683717 RepID=UPI001356769B|nr:ribosomal protein S18-alanine N-acetyltransferase [Erysipelothrix urinaevulpis]